LESDARCGLAPVGPLLAGDTPHRDQAPPERWDPSELKKLPNPPRAVPTDVDGFVELEASETEEPNNGREPREEEPPEPPDPPPPRHAVEAGSSAAPPSVRTQRSGIIE